MTRNFYKESTDPNEPRGSEGGWMSCARQTIWRRCVLCLRRGATNCAEIAMGSFHWIWITRTD